MKSTKAFWNAPATAAVLLVIGVAACVHRNAATPPTDLTGSWALNREESDRPQGGADLGRAGQGGRGGTDRGNPGGAGGRGGTIGGRGRTRGIPGGTGGRGGIPGSDIPGRGRGRGGGNGRTPSTQADRAESVRTALEMIVRGGARLTIAYTDSTVKIASADGESEIRANGKTTKAYVRDVGEVETKAKWKDGSLLIERKLESGAKIEETFTRAPGSPRLIVMTVLKGGPRELEFRRVYDPEPR